jgi:hypothetical protein
MGFVVGDEDSTFVRGGEKLLIVRGAFLPQLSSRDNVVSVKSQIDRGLRGDIVIQVENCQARLRERRDVAGDARIDRGGMSTIVRERRLNRFPRDLIVCRDTVDILPGPAIVSDQCPHRDAVLLQASLSRTSVIRALFNMARDQVRLSHETNCLSPAEHELD